MAANPFTDHPASVGESYLGHLCAAARFGVLLISAGAACLLHALCPWLCTHTARDRVARLHAELQGRSPRQHTPPRNAQLAGGVD